MHPCASSSSPAIAAAAMLLLIGCGETPTTPTTADLAVFDAAVATHASGFSVTELQLRPADGSESSA